MLFEALFPKRRTAVCAFAVAAMIAAIALDLLAPVPDLSFGGTLGGRGGFGVFITACALLSALLGFGYFAKGGSLGLCAFPQPYALVCRPRMRHGLPVRHGSVEQVEGFEP